MKTKKYCWAIIVLIALLITVIQLHALAAISDSGPGPSVMLADVTLDATDNSTSQPEVLNPAPDAVVKFIAPLVVKYPWISAACLIIGALRFLVKPVIASIHWYAERTDTPKDDEWIARVESSKFLKWFCFGLDWFASIKVVRK